MPSWLPFARRTAKVALQVTLVALVEPWVLFALVRALAGRLDRLVHGLLALRFAFADRLRCPRGHLSELRGIFECRGCGGLFAGWAFEECPVCGASCGHVACERCGMAVRNPLL